VDRTHAFEKGSFNSLPATSGHYGAYSLLVLYYNLQVSWDIFFPSHLVADTVAICRSMLPALSSAVTGNRHAQMCFVVSSR
jgi:hypothetical protein